jgi:DNA adenine methylase
MPRSESVVQLDLFGEPLVRKPVNVSSVPQRSPFRYPGGKTWLVPRLRQWLRHLQWKPTVFVEPFAGGGIISLTVAFEKLADKVVMVELDTDVAAVWQTILGENNEWLAQKIVAFDVSIEAVKEIISVEPQTVKERAFRTIVRNRTYHGGILAGGSALIKSGENGKGIKSRWYANTLATRIRAIAEVSHRIEFICGDGIEVMKQHARKKQAAFFIDPPYTAAGKRAGSRLYTHHELDHETLFDAAATTLGDILMIVAMADSRGFNTTTVAMKNTHHAVMDELLIGRDLSWV